MKQILFIGQLSPPINGQTSVNRAIVALLSNYFHVDTVDTTTGTTALRPLRILTYIYKNISCCVKLYFQTDHRHEVAYVSCNNNWGLFFSIVHLSIVSGRSRRIFLHHHSFRYVNKVSWLMYYISKKFRGSLNHVFLCNEMKNLFQIRYGEVDNVIIDNSAFITASNVRKEQKNDGYITIGLISNLSHEKGLDIFLEIVRKICHNSSKYQAILAGPASSSDKLSIEEIGTDELFTLNYRGPVYGLDKIQFYKDIDILVFPTRYATEAQPLVIFEAHSYGVPVVSTPLGCIPDQISDYGGDIYNDENYGNYAIDKIQQLSETLKSTDLSQQIIDNFYKRKTTAKRNFLKLFNI